MIELDIENHRTASATEKLAAMHQIIKLISNKWTVLVLAVLCHNPSRFNYIKKALRGHITQKALVESLRRLERSGFVKRNVITTSPVAVEYELTPLANTLLEPFSAMQEWALQYGPEVVAAEAKFDSQPENLAAKLA